MSSEIRRKHTGRPGNGGQFDGHVRTESLISLPEGSPARNETVFTKRFESLPERLEAFRTEIDSAIGDLDKAENWEAYIAASSKFPHYSFTNMVLVQLQRPDATMLGGFDLWKRYGRRPVEGAIGIRIFAPNRRKVDAVGPDGSVLTDPKGRPIKEQRIIGTTAVSVFDITQTEGAHVPSIDHSMSVEPPEGFRENLTDALASAGFTAASRTELSPAEDVFELARELANAKAGNRPAGTSPEQVDIENDTIARILCRANGMVPPGKQAADDRWAGGDIERIRASGERISMVVRRIVSERTWRNVDSGVLSKSATYAAFAISADGAT